MLLPPAPGQIPLDMVWTLPLGPLVDIIAVPQAGPLLATPDRPPLRPGPAQRAGSAP